MIVDIGRALGDVGLPIPIECGKEWGAITLGDEEISAIGPVLFKGLATGYPDHVLVEGTVEATLQLSCGRCLSSYSYPVKIDISEEYGRTVDEEHPDRYLFEGYTIDLSAMVEDNIISRLPIARFCRQDCLGLCPSCGQNLNEKACACPSDVGEILPAWKAALKQHKEE